MKFQTSSIRKYLCAAAAALVALAVAGCDNSAPEEKASAAPQISQTQQQAQPQDEQAIALNIGTLKIAALSNLYAADRLGYFQQEGVKATFTQMGGGAELLPAVSAGKIDITLSIPSNAIQARDKGFDFRMVMQNEVAAAQGSDSQAVFVNGDSGIANVKDLKGKRIAVNFIGNQMWLSLVEVLKQNGIGKDEVSFIELPFPNMQDALVNKQVDAVFNVEPFTSRMKANPALKVISYAAVEALPGQPVGTFWASGKWLESHPQAAGKFVRAMNKANEYLAQHPDEARKMVSEYTGLKPEAVEQMGPILWSSKVDPATLQRLLDLMKEHGLIASDMKVEDVVFPTAMQ